MSIAQKVKHIESKINTSPALSVDAWYRGLAAVKEKAPPSLSLHSLDVAFLLARNGIIDKPSSSLWEKLSALWDAPVEQWTNSMLWIASMGWHQYKDDPEFDDDESRDTLCGVAWMYWETFKSFPAHSDDRQRVNRHDCLCRQYLAPALYFACPELAPHGHAAFIAWLESINPETAQTGELLASLRAYVAGIKGGAN
jgi:hypothetical protein